MNKSELAVAVLNLKDDDPILAAVDAALHGRPLPERPATLRLFLLGDAARALQVSRPTLNRMIDEGRVKTVEIRTGVKRVAESELLRLVGGAQ